MFLFIKKSKLLIFNNHIKNHSLLFHCFKYKNKKVGKNERISNKRMDILNIHKIKFYSETIIFKLQDFYEKKSIFKINRKNLIVY